MDNMSSVVSARSPTKRTTVNNKNIKNLKNNNICNSSMTVRMDVSGYLLPVYTHHLSQRPRGSERSYVSRRDLLINRIFNSNFPSLSARAARDDASVWLSRRREEADDAV